MSFNGRFINHSADADDNTLAFQFTTFDVNCRSISI